MCRWKEPIDWKEVAKGSAGREGKIEGRGTRRGIRPGLLVGWRGTRQGGYGAVLRSKWLVQDAFVRASPDRVRWSWCDGAL